MKTCTCKYCKMQYNPHLNIKNPIACSQPKCQKLRQKDNEKAWHDRNKTGFDKEYHKLMRKNRDEELKILSNTLSDCISKGMRFLGEIFNIENISEFFLNIFKNKGIKFANKLCLVL